MKNVLIDLNSRYGGLALWSGLFFAAFCLPLGAEPTTNSLGMKLVTVPSGTFRMGSEQNADWKQKNLSWDEAPVHEVVISAPFALAATEVTNAQYEEFQPDHRKRHARDYRVLGMGDKDNDPVTYVSWNDAVDFCKWLSEKEGKTYRLPTEAEWEYACRAGTTTDFYTGDSLNAALKKNQKSPEDKFAVVDTTVGKTPPNAWGFFDMHGNVEEWVSDWYGPYLAGRQVDPMGNADGIYKVSRGGSHNTGEYFLRSANRSGTLPDDSNALIGFRVAMGPNPKGAFWPKPGIPPIWQNVSQKTKSWQPASGPQFIGPLDFVKEPSDGKVPFFKHNHSPAIAWCPNGDLLCFWFSTSSELGRELCVLGSRLREGAKEWEPASLVAKAPDRNMHGFSLVNKDNELLFFEGINMADRHDNIALALSTSKDSGATWTRPKMVFGTHSDNYQCASGVVVEKNGNLLLPYDGKGQPRSTRLLESADAGQSWRELTSAKNRPVLDSTTANTVIAGWHANVVQLDDGSLYALGREAEMGDGRMPQSVSTDGGATWTYSATIFPSVGTSQRMLLLKLKEEALLLVSFTDDIVAAEKNQAPLQGFVTKDAAGQSRRLFGLFTALSFDGGKSWGNIKSLSPGGPPKTYSTVRNTEFVMDATHSVPNGYLAGTQTPDGAVHIVTSSQYFRTNLTWLKAAIPVASPEEKAREAAAEKALAEGAGKPAAKPKKATGLNFNAE